MYHYTYIIINTVNEKYYIGVRSCNIDPILDIDYLGSSKYLNEDIAFYGKNSFIKDIIKVFDNRQDAMNHEIELHHYFDVENSNLFYNKFNANTLGFTWYGKNHSSDTIEKIKEKRKFQKITKEQIEKFKETWNEKSKQEKEEYTKFRKNVWSQKSKQEKDEFRKKMSIVSKKVWQNIPEKERKQRAKKILQTKSHWSKEKKEKDFQKRSLSQKKSKNSRTQEEITNAVEKRKKTYENMSDETKREISNKRNKKIRGRKWYNNGKESKMFFEDSVPEGFKLGRKF
jgi:hypothetical protein